jgi:hypothetical protein
MRMPCLARRKSVRGTTREASAHACRCWEQRRELEVLEVGGEGCVRLLVSSLSRVSSGEQTRVEHRMCQVQECVSVSTKLKG